MLKIATKIGIYPKGIGRPEAESDENGLESRALRLLKRFGIDSYFGPKDKEHIEFHPMPGEILLVEVKDGRVKIANAETLKVMFEGKQTYSQIPSKRLVGAKKGQAIFTFNLRDPNAIEAAGLKLFETAIKEKTGLAV